MQEYRDFAHFRKKPSDPGAAKVGNTVTTMVLTCYKHPRYPIIKLWDVPGVGTRNERVATYWEKMELHKCDAYLIFANGRFTENVGTLADKVHSVGKKFFVIRAEIDVDLCNAMHEQGLKSFTDEQEHKELLKIRKDCLANLKGVERNLVDVYLISNRSPDKWDFGRLTKAILQCDAL